MHARHGHNYTGHNQFNFIYPEKWRNIPQCLVDFSIMVYKRLDGLEMRSGGHAKQLSTIGTKLESNIAGLDYFIKEVRENTVPSINAQLKIMKKNQKVKWEKADQFIEDTELNQGLTKKELQALRDKGDKEVEHQQNLMTLMQIKLDETINGVATRVER